MSSALTFPPRSVLKEEILGVLGSHQEWLMICEDAGIPWRRIDQRGSIEVQVHQTLVFCERYDAGLLHNLVQEFCRRYPTPRWRALLDRCGDYTPVCQGKSAISLSVVEEAELLAQRGKLAEAQSRLAHHLASELVDRGASLLHCILMLLPCPLIELPLSRVTTVASELDLIIRESEDLNILGTALLLRSLISRAYYQRLGIREPSTRSLRKPRAIPKGWKVLFPYLLQRVVLPHDMRTNWQSILEKMA